MSESYHITPAKPCACEKVETSDNCHPIAGAATGALIGGAIAGPVGMAVGAVFGAMVGGSSCSNSCECQKK